MVWKGAAPATSSPLSPPLTPLSPPLLSLHHCLSRNYHSHALQLPLHVRLGRGNSRPPSASLTLCLTHPLPLSPSASLTRCLSHPLPHSPSAYLTLCLTQPLLHYWFTTGLLLVYYLHLRIGSVQLARCCCELLCPLFTRSL